MRGWVSVPLALACVFFGCPANPNTPEAVVDDPPWFQGDSEKVFRVRVKSSQGRTFSAQLSYGRLAVGEAADARTVMGTAAGQDAYQFTIPAAEHPETFVRSETFSYRWVLTEVVDSGTGIRLDTGPRKLRVGCTLTYSDDWLVADQERWIEVFDNLNDAQLAALGYFPSHGPLALKGLGLTYFHIPSLYGEPSIVFYEDGLPPRRLAGWGYAWDYDPLRHAQRACIPFEAWFVHEQGWHLPDGSYLPMPPGTVVVPPPGSVFHPRLWDVHIWRRDNGVPQVSILDETLAQDAAPVPEGTFIYVPWSPPI